MPSICSAGVPGFAAANLGELDKKLKGIKEKGPAAVAKVNAEIHRVRETLLRISAKKGGPSGPNPYRASKADWPNMCRP